MGIKIIYTKDNLVRLFRDVCALVLRDWDEIAAVEDGDYITLQLESGDEIEINTGYGVCDWIENYLDESDMHSCYESWSGYSGSCEYPVGGSTEYHHSNEDNKYRNPDRRALVEWVLECTDLAIEYMENEDE